MDFQSLSRRQLQSLCKKNKIRANITNVAMVNALNSLPSVEGIEEFLNSEISQSSMVPPTGGRTRTAKAVRTTTRRKAASASTSVPTKIEVSSNKSLDIVDDNKGDLSVKTPTSRRRVVRETSTVKPVCSIRRSARLAKKIENSKERSEAIKVFFFAEEIDEKVEVEMRESSVDQSQISEITVLDNFQKILTLSEEVEVKNIDESKAYSEDESDVPRVEDIVASDIKADTEMSFNVEKETKASTEKDTGMNTHMDEDTEMSSNVDEETHASTEKGTEMQSNLDEEETAMTPNVEEEIEASIEEKTIMNFNVGEEETNASNETDVIMDEGTKDIAMNYDVDEEPKAFIEKDTILDEEDTDMDFKKKSRFSEEIELKNNDESEVNLEESSDIPNGAVAVASIEIRVEIKTDPDQEEDGPADGLMKDDDAVETKAEVDEERAGTEVVQEYNVSEKMCGMDTETYSNVAEDSRTLSFLTQHVYNIAGHEESDISENRCSDDEEFDISDFYQEEFCVPEVGGIGDMGKDEPLNGKDISVTEFNQEEMNVLEVHIQDGDENETADEEESDVSDENEMSDHEESDKSDENETLNDEESDMSHGDELDDDKTNLDSDFAVDVSVTESNQEELLAISEDITVSKVEIQDEDELDDDKTNLESAFAADVSDENEMSDHEESDKSDENETLDDEESDMSHGDELDHDKANLDSDFAVDVSVTESNQEELPICEDITVSKVEIQDEDELDDDKTNLESAFVVDVSVTESNQEELAISEDIDVSKVEIQDEDELLNSEAKRESDPIHIVAPLENDDASSIESFKAPRSVQRLTHILKDDKENVGSGRKSGSLKDGKPMKKPLEDSSIVALAKMLQDNWNISKQQNEEGKEDENIFIKSTTTRPALKALSENCMGFQSQN